MSYFKGGSVSSKNKGQSHNEKGQSRGQQSESG